MKRLLRGSSRRLVSGFRVNKCRAQVLENGGQNTVLEHFYAARCKLKQSSTTCAVPQHHCHELPPLSFSSQVDQARTEFNGDGVRNTLQPARPQQKHLGRVLPTCTGLMLHCRPDAAAMHMHCRRWPSTTYIPSREWRKQ